jgi:cytochrome c
MPFYNSKSLTNDELYATTAYVLYLNGLVGESDVMNAETLPKVQMPNRDGFVPFRPGD